MTDFIELQAKHEELLRQESVEIDILAEAQDYIDLVRLESRNIFPPKEREQLRANIRYWATYVFSKTEHFPNTELAPFSGDVPKIFPWRWILAILGALFFGKRSVGKNRVTIRDDR